MKFYKYPECEPIKGGFYLCIVILKGRPNSKSFEVVRYHGNKEEFTGPLMDAFEVLAYSYSTPEEAIKNAQI